MVPARPTIHTVMGEGAAPAVKSVDTPLESGSHVAPESVECSIDPAGPMRQRTAGSGDAISVGVMTCFDSAAARARSTPNVAAGGGGAAGGEGAAGAATARSRRSLSAAALPSCGRAGAAERASFNARGSTRSAAAGAGRLRLGARAGSGREAVCGGETGSGGVADGAGAWTSKRSIGARRASSGLATQMASAIAPAVSGTSEPTTHGRRHHGAGVSVAGVARTIAATTA